MKTHTAKCAGRNRLLERLKTFWYFDCEVEEGILKVRNFFCEVPVGGECAGVGREVRHVKEENAGAQALDVGINEDWGGTDGVNE